LTRRGGAPANPPSERTLRIAYGLALVERNTLEVVPVPPASDALLVDTAAAGPTVSAVEALAPLTFDQVYEEHFSFVWRNARCLGIAPGAVEDVVQDVFVVVHRRLSAFDATRSSIRTWLFGILRRIVADHRRTRRRKPAHFGTDEGDQAVESLIEPERTSPHESAARAEAARVLASLLDRLDDDKREVFVLAEIEQMTVPEIAEATGLNLNTAYARLRAARQEFEEAVKRRRARDGWGVR
jgi:RNA polymerase sigma-70 factor, ECF subfamily